MIQWKRRKADRHSRSEAHSFLEAGAHWPVILEMQYYEQLLYSSLDEPSAEQLYWHVKARNAFVAAGGIGEGIARGR